MLGFYCVTTMLHFCMIPDVECGQMHFDFDHFLSKKLESADISDGYLITRCVLFVCYFNGGDDKLFFKNSILNNQTRYWKS